MTTCFTCQTCDKTFKSERALNGHSRVHSSLAYNAPKVDTRITCPQTGKRVLPHLWQGYQSRLRTCNNEACGKVFEGVTGEKALFCSRSCAATVNNTGRTITQEQREKVANSLNSYFESTTPEERLQTAKTPKFCKIYYHVCTECDRKFIKNVKQRMTCSPYCANSQNSRRMMDKIIGDSAGNFSLKQPGFTYKGVTVDCDSKLETAAVMYLIDVMGATSITRGTAILHYYDQQGGHHRFLPDFYVRTEDDRWMVEVKQVQSQSPKLGKYNRYFAEKREALIDFCERKGLQPLWLDFDHDPRFQKIYRKVISK